MNRNLQSPRLRATFRRQFVRRYTAGLLVLMGTLWSVPTQTLAQTEKLDADKPASEAGENADADANKVRAPGSEKRFVYVIDCSGSMATFDAFEYAKAGLLASLEELTPEHKFQVIFYHEEAAALDLLGSGTQLVAGTDVNRMKAKRQINAVYPSLGTRHEPALLAALKYKPDVIFLLTDAEEGELQPNELQKIKQMNRSNAQIHCIELGKGKERKADNSFKKLARQNNGTHTYLDIIQRGQEE